MAKLDKEIQSNLSTVLKVSNCHDKDNLLELFISLSEYGQIACNISDMQEQIGKIIEEIRD